MPGPGGWETLVKTEYLPLQQPTPSSPERWYQNIFLQKTMPVFLVSAIRGTRLTQHNMTTSEVLTAVTNTVLFDRLVQTFRGKNVLPPLSWRKSQKQSVRDHWHIQHEGSTFHRNILHIIICRNTAIFTLITIISAGYTCVIWLITLREEGPKSTMGIRKFTKESS